MKLKFVGDYVTACLTSQKTKMERRSPSGC